MRKCGKSRYTLITRVRDIRLFGRDASGVEIQIRRSWYWPNLAWRYPYCQWFRYSFYAPPKSSIFSKAQDANLRKLEGRNPGCCGKLTHVARWEWSVCSHLQESEICLFRELKASPSMGKPEFGQWKKPHCNLGLGRTQAMWWLRQ